MDERVKFRLVGAIVVLLMALVILPPLLKAPLVELNRNQYFPPKPERPKGLDIEVKRHDWTIGDLLTDQSEPDMSSLNPNAAATKDSTTQETSEPNKEDRTDNSTETMAVADEKTQSTEPQPKTSTDANLATAEAPSPIKKPIIKMDMDESGSPKTWMIQVGSFSKTANAKRLEAQLIEKGYSAQIRASQDFKMTRVYVGPSMDKQGLEAEQKKIEQTFNLKARIVRYSPAD